jgi:hypothetical protein
MDSLQFGVRKRDNELADLVLTVSRAKLNTILGQYRLPTKQSGHESMIAFRELGLVLRAMAAFTGE